MAKVKIQGHASGTGVITVTAPNTSTDRTITLPDTTGTLLDENSSVPAANLTGTVADARISALTASKLTGALPAISGANLTGLSAADNTPSFSASLSSNQTTSVNVYTKIQFATENWDTDSAYDTSNYRFTVPSGEAGKYLINVYLRTDGSSSWNLQYPIVVYKNGGAIDYQSTAFGSSRARHGEVYTKVLNLSVGDYIEVYSTPGTGGNTFNSSFCSFSGYKLAGV